MTHDEPVLDIAAVRHVAKLARLAIAEDRLGDLQRELTAILGHIALLQEVNTDGLEPLAHPLPLTNRLRDDVPGATLSVESVLSNAPAREGDFLAVPKVLTGESS